MERRISFFTLLFLLSIIGGSVPSNPDSEIVQDSSGSSDGPAVKSMPIQDAESQSSVVVLSDRYSGIKVFRPYNTDAGTFWREIRDYRIRIRDRDGYVDVARVSDNDRIGGGNVARPGGNDRVGGGNVARPSGNDRVGGGDDARPGVNDRVGDGDDARPGGNDRVGGGDDAISGDNDRVRGGDDSRPGGAPSNLPPSKTDADRRANAGSSADGTRYSDLAPLNGGVRRQYYGYYPSRQDYYGNRQRNSGSVKGASSGVPAVNGSLPPNGEASRDATRGNRTPPTSRNPEATPTPKREKKISPDSNFFAGIVNDFTFRLVRSLNLDSNFVVSPLSIFIALSVCYLGAGGRTKSQLEQGLGLNEFSVHGVHLHQGISDLLSMISPDFDEYQLFVSSGVFLGKNFTVEEAFKEDVQKFYGAKLKTLDFSDPAASLRAINEWVANGTRNTITSLVDSPLPALTRLILLNAIFFRGIWKTQFPLDLTYNGQFFSSDGTEKEVPYMTMYREVFPFFRSTEHKHSFLKLPYKGDHVSMIIALPDERQRGPMPDMTDQTLCHVRDAMQNERLNTVSVPKFRLEYLESLREPLMRMGVTDIFGTSADLRKMRKQNDVFVSHALHKAVVDVNEEGTTAAAATGVRITPLTSSRSEFEANHPFAFYIVHEESGLVIFYGKIFDIGKSTGVSWRRMRPPPSDRRESGYAPSNNGREGPARNGY